jgi:hypothetical protein
MRRGLFTFASFVSFLLFIATAGLWVRGLWVQDRLSLSRSAIVWDFANVDGALRYSREEDWPDRPPSPDASPGFQTNYLSGERVLGDGDLSFEGEAQSMGWEGFGFVICPAQISSRPSMTSATLYIVPLWFVALVTVAMPMAWLRPVGRVRRWHKRRPGRCSHCCYDLSGNVSGVCPECGNSVSGKGEA